MEFIDKNFVIGKIKKRSADANKFTVGVLHSFCGSYGMAGASIMSAKSALRSGIGLLHLYVPESIYPIMASVIPEAVFHPYNFIKEVLCITKGNHSSAVVVGCGLSVNDNSKKLVNTLVENCPLPMVLDADALNIVAENPSVLLNINRDIIVTPHNMEMARLLGWDLKEVLKDREKACKTFSKKYGVITVLKGKETLISTPKCKVVCNNLVGNSGMAVGGSGDVLAGIIASLLAQGNDAFYSACAGVYIHGLAGDIAKEKYGEVSMLPTDIINSIPQAFKKLKF